ncbi:MAG: hypothetical protein TR69_WS6001000464 [candidate division WS6 bacterium OLB20]|uniref:UPF0246 protein TR69_WS6001000464 n=1 Tax=candidate division WS6 bacterium OLB20 TaxID=1617426 RepID=A0A136LXR9_9BACT|nr:MAG: hypothetical protein TR69_WS6001000464 [candidate division WS6 bacterium OLB20]
MLVLITPAKRLLEEHSNSPVTPTAPDYIAEAAGIVRILRKLSTRQLARLYYVSDKIAELNHERLVDWSDSHTQKNSFTALTMFNGDVFRELDLKAYSDQQLEKTQHHLRIISGLYGILRPFDLVHPYRLEMGTKLNYARTAVLSEYWQQPVAKHINATGHDSVLSLLSNEYRAAVSDSLLNMPVTDVDFKEWRDGKYVTVGILAKRARGKMLHHLISQGRFDIETVKSFSAEGYSLLDEQHGLLVFARKR